MTERRKHNWTEDYYRSIALEYGVGGSKDEAASLDANTLASATAWTELRTSLLELASAAGQLPTILVIDDSYLFRRIFQAHLEDHFACKVIGVENGPEAWRQITNGATPDLVISDFLMPYMDGLTLYETVKKEPKLANIPFIFLSGDNSPKTVDRAKELGIKHWILKSNSFDEILRSIRTMLTDDLPSELSWLRVLLRNSN